MTTNADLFPEWTSDHIDADGVSLFVRHSGAPDKPALVLLHGYPQTSAMWHRVGPLLTQDFHVICPDLRGYGRSDKPTSLPDHSHMSKRAMAGDICAVLDHFDHATAFVGAHDRGARVAHRLGLEAPDRIQAMVLLDIAPTREMYANTSTDFAKAYWHWFFLIQPAPFPEQTIGRDARQFWLSKCIHQAGGYNPFHPDALEEYLSCFETPDAIRTSCDDYRAAATIDIAHDDADGTQKLDVPIHVLWAKRGVIERCFDALALWNTRAHHVSGHAVQASHYMAEEIPEQIAADMRHFFAQHA